MNTDEILIFKLRGKGAAETKPGAKEIKKEQFEHEAAPAPIIVPEAQPAAPATKEKRLGFFGRKPKKEQMERAPPPAPIIFPEEKPVVIIPETQPAAPAQKEKRLGFFGRKPKKMEAKEEKVVKVEGAEAYAEESKLREVENLEERATAAEYIPAEVVESHKARNRSTRVLSILTGVFFIFNSGVFGYFIYPESIFVLNYIEKIGFITFLSSWNYGYDIAFINLLLMALTGLSGLLLIARTKQSHFIGGVIVSLMVLTATYEYLNSNATYLLIIGALSFASIVALLYSRMSAVSTTEQEELPENISWPKVETF